MPAPASDLSLRPTVIGGDHLDDDYQMIWDGIRSGASCSSRAYPPAGRTGHGALSSRTSRSSRGLVSDLEECKRRFKIAWSAVHAQLTDADIRKAHEQAEDNRKRWKA